MENPYRSPETPGAPKPRMRLPFLRALIVGGGVGLAVGILIPRISPIVKSLWAALFP
jgi:hypothetical protein